MQFIALRDFYRTPDLADLDIKDKINDRHIHKGAIFEIGTGKKALKDLSKPDQVIVATLALAKCVGDATDAKLVQAVKDEIALDKRREENAKKLNDQAALSHLSSQLAGLLAKAAASK